MPARHSLRRAIALVAALSLAACAEPAPEGDVGAPAPDYSAVTLAGDSVSLASLRGRTVLLNVWATWCFPCREELPALQQLHETYGGQGLDLVGVSVDALGSSQAIEGFAKRYGVTYALWHDPDNAVSLKFRGIGVPLSVLIGPDGTVRWKHLGPVRADDPALLAALEESLRDVERPAA